MGEARLKQGLAGAQQGIQKLRTDVERVKAEGKKLDNYSLGFTNGVIFCEHVVSGRGGKAKTYNDELSIGEGVPLPRPVKFQDELDQDAEAQEELDKRIDQIFIASKKVINLFTSLGALEPLGNAIVELSHALELYGEPVYPESAEGVIDGHES